MADYSARQLLFENPLYLKTVPGGTYLDQYDVKLRSSETEIGFTNIKFGKDYKELVWPTLKYAFRHQGLGAALYAAAAEVKDEDGNNPLLRSTNYRFLSPGAIHAWESLAVLGLAERPAWENGHYLYIGWAALENIVDEAHDGVARAGDFDGR